LVFRTTSAECNPVRRRAVEFAEFATSFTLVSAQRSDAGSAPQDSKPVLRTPTPPFSFSVFCGKGLQRGAIPFPFRRRTMNKPSPVNPPELRSTFVAASSMPWQRTDFDGIEMKILYKDDEGRSTILFKMAPGAVVPLHEHTALEQTFMLEGSLEDSEGSVGAGDFVWRPGGNIHVAHAPNGAMFLSVFTRPNRFFDGTKFFTSAKERG
jgi:quercetin dioxygenase-like cupin family protein